MNILVIGNGFDLAHGLPTKYGDFLNFVKAFQNSDDLSDDPKNEFYKYFSNIKNDRLNLYQELDELTTDNRWLRYFIRIYEDRANNGKEGWIDFECEISSIIQTLDAARLTLNEEFKEGKETAQMKQWQLNILCPILNVDGKIQDYRVRKFTKISIGTIKYHLYDDLNKLIRCLEIDSCEEEINARTRGAGTLEKIKLFIAELLKRNFRNFYLATTPLTSEMSVTPSISTLPQMLRFATNVGAMGLYVNMLKPDGRMDYSQYKQFNIDEYWNGVHKTYEEQRRLYELGFDNIALFAGSDFNQILEGYCFSENCGLGCSELAINYDGNVYPCASLMKDDFLLGNIKEMCISDLYKKSYSIYSECTVDNMEHCKECDERYICGGGCRALAYAYSKNISGENPHCKQCKSQIHFWQLMSVNLYQKDVEND